MTHPPTDQAARVRIRTDLGTNMLVEAGAGSGKTTSLVDRMLEHVRTGTPVERLTAVTFTRKAANELRERFQVRLERELRESPAASDETRRCEQALRELDRAFLGTIHAFCARLLRERPLEVGLDPNFKEVSEEGWEELKKRFWRRWVERARRDDDAGLAALYEVGIDPSMLYDGFKTVMTYPDVEFSLTASAKPDTSSCRRELEKLIVAARGVMPKAEPSDGWDDLMKLVRRLEFKRNLGGFDSIAGFCDALESISEANCKLTQKRWSDTKEGKARAKELGESFVALLDGPAADVLRCWREHRYPVVMSVLQRAAADFERERHATGQLGFEDLLLLSAKLLRENPAARDDLGARYAHLLVDEFQDTDPIQAEVCFLLTSDSREGNDWRSVTPRPGSLFVVGDPKQSIFRFRRADIQIYELVKRRMESFGVVLPLTANFRSVSSVEAVVNGHFAGVFPPESTPEQAPYRPMETRRDPVGNDGVFTYIVRPPGRGNKDDVLELDAAMVASWIAARVAGGEKSAGDFMILCATREPIARYARALTERNVAVATTGARLPQEHELRELLVVLRAIADPEHAIGVVAALEGLFFGLSPADLWTASRRGIRFAVTHRPSDELDATSRALLQLHAWWQTAQRHPADVLLERILDDSGLLLHAAAQPLGEARAGALLHLVESLRTASVLGAIGLPDAMERLEVVLGADAADAPLRPGRTDAVRVMNLHKAKGLEADVVVLAAPLDVTIFDPTVHIARGDAGRATGGLCIEHRDGQRTRLLAHPPRWAEMQAKEASFQQAEKARLLYVAATRAKRELIVAQCEKALAKGTKVDDSMWRPLAPVLDEHASQRVLAITAAPGRRKVERTAVSLAAATTEATERVRAAGTASLRFVTVTEEAKGTDAESSVVTARATGERAPKGRGTAWGRAVHRSMEALGRGRSGESLRAFVRAVAAEEELDAESSASLLPAVERAAASEVWQALLKAGVPSVELTVMRRTMDDGVETITEGVIDAAALGLTGWRVVDWKSDVVDDAGWAARQEKYARQVDSYVKMLVALTGHEAKGVVVRLRD
ncbi:MAG TPA: UvrD-helicase domain-containing protein [Gemmatimonadaceae bacterium]|nr:UvrD-helicase domain-containing protein [Gemmatimonadaceae bacterium]